MKIPTCTQTVFNAFVYTALPLKDFKAKGSGNTIFF